MICGAKTHGVAIGSRALTFHPGTIRPGRYTVVIGTAGSATLVLQTVLPALIGKTGPSELILEGGTHNPWAPPFDFLQRVFLPLLARMGPQVTAEMDRPGFYPAGGGRIRVLVQPVERLQPLALTERGELVSCCARALLARLPEHIAERELSVIGRELGWPQSALVVERFADALGPGNALCLEVHSTHVTELFTGFGRLGVRAESVAHGVARQVQRYLTAGVPVGEHLADQLLVPLALGGGRFVTCTPSRHLRTNRQVIGQFIDRKITIEPTVRQRWEVRAARPD
jgi:RNA 3'-terminal phosphate cyclase (ATP)